MPNTPDVYVSLEIVKIKDLLIDSFNLWHIDPKQLSELKKTQPNYTTSSIPLVEKSTLKVQTNIMFIVDALLKGHDSIIVAMVGEKKVEPHDYGFFGTLQGTVQTTPSDIDVQYDGKLSGVAYVEANNTITGTINTHSRGN